MKVIGGSMFFLDKNKIVRLGAHYLHHFCMLFSIISILVIVRPVGKDAEGAIGEVLSCLLWLSFTAFLRNKWATLYSIFIYAAMVAVFETLHLVIKLPDSLSVWISFNIISICYYIGMVKLKTIWAKVPYGLSLVESLVQITVYCLCLTLLTMSKFNGFVFDIDSVLAVLQTNSQEGLEFFSMQIGNFFWVWSGLLVVGSAVIWGWSRVSFVAIQNRVNIPLLLTVAMLGTIDFTPFLEVVTPIGDACKSYFLEYDEFQKTKLRFQKEHSFFASKKGRGELHVLVIGESSNKNMYSSYGYRKDTTPWIKASTKVQFSQAFSNHTHTVATLKLALTQANQYNNLNFYKTPSLLTVLNKADFHTEWLSNQCAYGPWDNVVTSIATEADYFKSLNTHRGVKTKTFFYDEKLVSLLHDRLALRDPSKNTFIVIHLMGNHGSYRTRYPNSACVFKEKDLFLYGDKENITYDNSIRYVDNVLKQIFDELRTQQGFMSLTYLADHGEDPVGRRGHNSAQFTQEMSEIPMIIWASELYKKNYLDRYSALSLNKDRYFTNDLLFDTMLGILNVKTEKLSVKNDISSPQYQCSVPMVLHGKRSLLNVPSKVSSRNIKLIENGTKRLLAHRVNTIGAYDDAVKYGFESFEIDLFYDEVSRKLLVGHGKNAYTGGSLDQYLELTDAKFYKMWFDIKNLNEKNWRNVLKILEELEDQYSLKSRVIVESGNTASFFSNFTEKGWHTSYYMPTGKIKKLMKENRAEAVKAYIELFKRELSYRRISAISFDASIYPFVKKHIEPVIDKTLQYHTWTWLHTKEKDFSKKLKAQSFFQDGRIKSIIVQSDSYFKR